MGHSKEYRLFLLSRLTLPSSEQLQTNVEALKGVEGTAFAFLTGVTPTGSRDKVSVDVIVFKGLNHHLVQENSHLTNVLVGSSKKPEYSQHIFMLMFRVGRSLQNMQVLPACLVF